MKKIIKKIFNTPIIFTLLTILILVIYIVWAEPKTTEITLAFIIALVPLVFCNIYLWELYFGKDLLDKK